jgi:fumarate hydratase class II
MAHRIEIDSMGEVKVDETAYWGAQTQRSLEFFRIGHERFTPHFIRSFALVKQAAAHVNAALGVLDEKKAKYIEAAATEIRDGKLHDQFPLAVWQTGSGTQTNMNLNEVIAHRANELMTGTRSSKHPIHPNDDVNKGQSTNDMFPTTMYVAASLAVQHKLLAALDGLNRTFQLKALANKSVVKLGRTHLQDATPVTLGQEISGWAAQLTESKDMILAIMPHVYALAAGGTAVGTGLNTHPKYAQALASYLAEQTGLPFTSAPNKFAALAAHDGIVALSGMLSVLAGVCMKVANDVRWLASGPRAGLYEIRIAENEPGSSIMPGKVNPTQCEALTMVCCQVMGNHTAINVAGSQGNFELNVYKPVMIHCLLQSIELLSDAMVSFDTHCARSIEPNTEHLKELTSRSLMLVTALAPHIGYDKAAAAAKLAHKDNLTLKEAVVNRMGLMSAEEFDAHVQPEQMLGPVGH